MYSLVTILLAVAVAVSSSVPAAYGQLVKQIQTIPLEDVNGRFDHFGADIQAKRLYVAALGNNTLEVMDIATGRRVKSISGLKKPTGIGVLPGSSNVVVASGDDGMVRIYDRDMNLLGTVQGLDDADNVRLDSQGRLAYVGYGDGAIAVIDPRQPSKIGEIRLDGHPESFQLEANGNRIFVNVPSARQVAVIDREKQRVVARWPVEGAEANFPMALDEQHHRLFIGCRRPSKLLVLETRDGKMVAAENCCGDTDDLFYDTATKRVYLTGGEGCISIFEQTGADHYRLVQTVDTAPGARTSLYLPALSRLYVAVPRRGNQQAEIRVYEFESKR